MTQPDLTNTSPNTDEAFCSRCGYRLFGTPLSAACPECGEPSSTRITTADFLKHDASRKFWVGKSLNLIHAALTLEIVLGLLQTFLITFGHTNAAVFFAITLGLWHLTLAAGAYTLFYGITRVHRKGYPVLARSILLYATGLLAALLFLQIWTLFSGSSNSINLRHLTPYVLISWLAFAPLLIAASIAIMLLLLTGVWFACSRLGVPIKRSNLIHLGILWVALCFLQALSTPWLNNHWAGFASSQPSLTYNLNLPSAGKSQRSRVYNALTLNTLYRVDPGPAFWGQIIGVSANAALHHHIPAIPGQGQSQNPLAYSIPTLKMSVTGASFVYPNSNSHFAPNYYRGTYYTPYSSTVGNQIFWPELLWAFTGWVLSLTFTLWLWLILLRVRKAFNRLHAST